MDTAQWPQEIVVKPIEEIVTNTYPKPSSTALERKARPLKEQALNCPRCKSTNTKFCYYNNYSLTQPRYFCKTCRRYWTEGGSLRNIPVGGGSRKNKRPSSSSSSKKLPDLVTKPPSLSSQNPNYKIHDHGQDLNLAFPAAATDQGFMSISELVQVPNIESNNKSQFPNSSSTTTTTTSHHQLSALELLTGISSSRGLNSFMPMPMQDFKPTLNFSLNGLGSGYGSLRQSVQEINNGRIFFPFEDSRQVSSTSDPMKQHRGEHGDSSRYWTGMLGGGSLCNLSSWVHDLARISSLPTDHSLFEVGFRRSDIRYCVMMIIQIKSRVFRATSRRRHCQKIKHRDSARH